MKFTKLVFHEQNWPDVFGRTLTLNFDKCELELQRFERVLSCCITKKECDSFMKRLAASHLEDWSDVYHPPVGTAVMDGSTWSLDLYDGESKVKAVIGQNAFPSMGQWCALTSVLDEAYEIAFKCGKNTPIENARRKLF